MLTFTAVLLIWALITGTLIGATHFATSGTYPAPPARTDQREEAA